MKGLVILPQRVDDLCGVQPHTMIASHLKLCYPALVQLHDTLCQLQLHAAALSVLLVKAPRKAQGMLANDRTAMNHHAHLLSLSVSVICSLILYYCLPIKAIAF